jgi:hypothetical protein
MATRFCHTLVQWENPQELLVVNQHLLFLSSKMSLKSKLPQKCWMLEQAAPPVIEPTTIWQVRMRIRATVFAWSLGCDVCTWTPQYTPFPRKVLKDMFVLFFLQNVFGVCFSLFVLTCGWWFVL